MSQNTIQRLTTATPTQIFSGWKYSDESPDDVWFLTYPVLKASQYNADRMQEHSRLLLAKNQRRQQLQNERYSLYHLPAVQLKSMHEQKKIPTEWQDEHIL